MSHIFKKLFLLSCSALALKPNRTPNMAYFSLKGSRVILTHTINRYIHGSSSTKYVNKSSVTMNIIEKARTSVTVATREELSKSSLFGAPTKSLVPPGECQYSDTFQPSKLLNKWQVSQSSVILRFELPDVTKALNLSTCACILAKASVNVVGANNGEKEDVIRPYTPISTNELIGSFDLLVKDYTQGKLSHHLNTMDIGEVIDFKHIVFNVKLQAPFPFKKICMIVGGTGITPMIQALHAILGDTKQKHPIEVIMLYGSRESSDILGYDLLQQWEKNNSSVFKVIHVLSNEPESSNWNGGKRGFITKNLIEEHFPSSKEDGISIFVCGPPPLYNAICGAREEKDVKGVLNELGYSNEQVYKF